MIVEAARAAARNLTSAELRGIILKVLGLTVLGLVAAWFAAREAFASFLQPLLQSWLEAVPWLGVWVAPVVGVLAGLGIAVALILLVAPVTAMVAGIFLDDIAEGVEHADYPADPPGRSVPALRSFVLAVKFLGIVILGNLAALLLLFVPLVNVAAFFLVNGYLLGREYFEFAAMRFRSEDEARELRRRHSATVFAAGLLIAALLAVPIVNLLTPAFAAAFMVHLHKRISGRDSGRGEPAQATLRRAA
jgi:CysZ protein